MIFSLFISGFSSVAILIPSMHELMYILNDLKAEENSVNDTASSIWNFAIDMGETFGSLTGGVITANYSFSSSCVSMSLINICFGLAYGLFNQNHIKKDILDDLNGKCLVNEIDPLILNREQKDLMLNVENKELVAVLKNKRGSIFIHSKRGSILLN